MSDYGWNTARQKNLLDEEEAEDMELKNLFRLELQNETGMPCDQAVDSLSDEELKRILDKARAKKKKRKQQLTEEEITEDEYQEQIEQEQAQAMQQGMCG